jgi:hypothetical protein
MLSKVIRRSHMYLALFLTPWMVMYALSTLLMNHRPLVERLFGGNQAHYEKEKELNYQGSFAPSAGPKEVARQILKSLDMEGAFSVRQLKGQSPQQLVILRNQPISPRRITYTPDTGKLVIEREAYRTPGFLERMHRRSGYQAGFWKENAWAFSVDLVILAMVFWVASGIWMWWELRLTRYWGFRCGIIGATLFVFFLCMI